MAYKNKTMVVGVVESEEKIKELMKIYVGIRTDGKKFYIPFAARTKNLHEVDSFYTVPSEFFYGLNLKHYD